MIAGRLTVSNGATVLCKLRLAAAAATQVSTLGLFDTALNGITSRSYSAAAPARLHFCVVGAGPAGFYIADKLLKRYGEHIRIDVLDQLPTPFGLVRSGVAPDHPETKNVEHQFTGVAQDPRSTFIGNVRVGRDVQLPELQSLYSGVVLAYGAESDRRLGIPGEGAPGVLPARKFVWWYNGHPHGGDVGVDLAAVRSVAVLGVGNVALDCARLLLAPEQRLAPTDVADRALSQLRQSAVQDVHLVARRSPAEAACTPKELREILGLAGRNVQFNTDIPLPSKGSQGAGTADRIKRRLHDIFSKAAAAAHPEPGARQLHFDFLRQPVEIVSGDNGAAQAVRLERTQLQQGDDGRVLARGTGQFELIPADLVLISIGYRSVPIEGAGFDADRGVILNRGGRVLDPEGRALHGTYACGWLMRGPTGIIGTNSANAELVADVIQEDTHDLRLIRGAEGGTDALLEVLAGRGVSPTSFNDWGKIDAAELRQGQLRGKVREKIVTMPELLQTAGIS